MNRQNYDHKGSEISFVKEKSVTVNVTGNQFLKSKAT